MGFAGKIKKMQITKDISIGKEEWIKWIEFDAISIEPLEVDDILEPIKPFLKGLETECMSECCGIDAYSFWYEEIVQSAAELNKNELKSHLNIIINELYSSNKEVISSAILNQLINREVFIQLLEHLKEKIKST